MRNLLLGLTVIGLAGCSAGGPSGPTSGGDNRPSANQTNAFAEQFARAFSNGVSAAASAAVAPAPGSGEASLSGVPISCNQSGCLVNEQVTARTNCTSGGRIEVNGSLTGSISQTGSGVLSLSSTETITDWRCIPPFVINGDPFLSAAGTMPFLNGQLSSAATFDFGGGFKWGRGANETFQINMSVIINPNGSGTVSGVAGPYSINASF